MKNLLTILLLFFAVVIKAQYVPNAGAYQYKGLKQTNSLQPPSIAGYPVTSINAPDSNYAALYYNKTDTTWYQFNPISKTWSPFRTAGGVQIDSVFITSIDSIFITNTDSIFIISGNDTIYIGNSDQIRDTAKLTAGYGLIIVSPSLNDSVGFYGPNYDDRTVILDTSVLGDFISYVINNDTTIINNNDSVPAIIVDTLSNSPPAGATSGYKVLIGTSPTGLFAGHANDIAELVGAVWTFTDPVCNQQVIVDNAITYATYQYNCPANIWKQTSVLWRVGGNKGVGNNAFIGRPDKQRFIIKSWNKVGLIVDTTRDVLLPKYTGLESEPLFFKPGANGKIDTGRFKIPAYATPVNMDSVLYIVNGDFKYGTATGGGGGSTVDTLPRTVWVDDFGARDDGKYFYGAAITTGTATLTVSGSTFVSGDVGKYIEVGGAGASGARLRTTIATYISATSVTLSTNASTTVTAQKGKFGTDNTIPIQNAIYATKKDSVFLGTVFFPVKNTGVYLVCDTVRTVDRSGKSVNSAQIYIPSSGTWDSIARYGSIKLLGEVTPNFSVDYLSRSAFVPQRMAIIQSTLETGNVIGSSYQSIGAICTVGVPVNINYTQVTVENLAVRVNNTNGTTVTQNKTTAFNLEYIGLRQMKNVLADIETTTYTAIAPDTVTSWGIKTMGECNWAFQKDDNIVVRGYGNGMTVNEHEQADNLFINGCYHGVIIQKMIHSAHVGRLLTQWNKNHIKVEGRSFLVIDEWDTEDVPGGAGAAAWTELNLDWYEPTTTNSQAVINYHIVGPNYTNPELNNITFSAATSNGIKFRKIGRPIISNGISFNYNQELRQSSNFTYDSTNRTLTIAPLSYGKIRVGKSTATLQSITPSLRVVDTTTAMIAEFTGGSTSQIMLNDLSQTANSRIWSIDNNVTNLDFDRLSDDNSTRTNLARLSSTGAFKVATSLGIGGTTTFTSPSIDFRINNGQTAFLRMLPFGNDISIGTSVSNGAVIFRRNEPTGTENGRFDGSGNFLIGTTTTNSTLTVNGSISGKYRAVGGTATVAATDHTIECTAGTFTVTLPTAASIADREYTIVNAGSGTITIATTSSQTFLNINGTPTTLTLAAVGAGAITSYTVRSNGAHWLVTGKVKNE